MQTSYDPVYWENLRANDGDIPREVAESRFWEMLEVLPPADWTRGDNFECFRMIECQTADLYTWLFCLGKPGRDGAQYWEMIAPRTMTPSDLLARIETARRVRV